MEKMMVRIRARETVKTALSAIQVGRASALEFDIVGAPEGLQSLQFHVGRVGREDFYAVEATAKPDNRWGVYANGLLFQDVGRTTYHISATDSKGNAVWLGKGRLEIVQAALPVSPEDIPVIPEDTYVRNPKTGLWHKLTCIIEDGMIVPQIEEEGVVK